VGESSLYRTASASERIKDSIHGKQAHPFKLSLWPGRYRSRFCTFRPLCGL